jgi:PAS domain S-box-containing protein
MTFARKIGLAFLLLSSLTVATGGIGLLFIQRVMNAFRSIPGSEAPVVGGLADLNRYLKQAVAISQAISSDQQVEGLLEQRRVFTRATREFERSFERIRRELGDEASVRALEEIKAEQSLLSQQTHALIDALLDVLQAQAAYRQTLDSSQRQWSALAEALREAITGLTGAAAAEESPGAILPLLLRTQHSVLESKLALQEYLAWEEDADPVGKAAQVRRLVGESSQAASALLAAAESPRTRGVLAGLRERLDAWAEGLTASAGLLALRRELAELDARMDQMADRTEAETRETLRLLDDLIAMGSRLAMSRADRGFVTAAPGLLLLSLSLAAGLSVLLAVVLSHAISRPVKRLIAVTEAVGRGDYSAVLPTAAGDELASLGASFNRMLAEIRRSQQQVRQLNAGLEQRVRERTEALEEEIRQRQKVEDSLRDSEIRYRTLIENFPAGAIILIDRRRRVVALGGRSLMLLGERESLAGQEVYGLLPPPLQDVVPPRLEAAFGGVKQEFEHDLGETSWRIFVVPNPPTAGGGIETITVLAMDVTEARRAEREMRRKQDQLVQADKLASLGVLVAGVAHEINNPNQAIMSVGQLLQRAWPDIRSLLETCRADGQDLLVGGLPCADVLRTLGGHLDGIVQSAQRIDTIVKGLKEFARQDAERMDQPVDLTRVVQSALVLLSNMLKKATENLRLELAQDLPAFRGNTQRIEQVVINLVQNACQALPDRRAAITIRTYPSELGREAVLEVVDEGEGISPENMSKVRDPFFTTKREMGGTGLGLSVSSTIVHEHRGELEFLSHPGKGTTVRVVFPADAVPQRGHQ